jgi:pimeloyl-ACP methyl ester carboxylesterase
VTGAGGRCETAAVASTYRSPRHAEQVRAWCRDVLATWAEPHLTHEVETSLGRTHLVSLGRGDAVCLYLPGTNFNAATSTAALEVLAARFRVHVPDLPGQPGLSEAARPVHEVQAYADWVAQLVTWVRAQHDGAPIVLAGHSRGAAVALSADPATVDGVALLSPAGLLGVRPTPQMLRATVPWLVRRDEGGAARLLRYMSGPTHVPSARLVEWMALVARTCRTTGAPGRYPDDVVAAWRGGNARVVVGEHDVFFPVDPLAAASRARLGTDPVVVPSAGHLLVDEEPDRIADLVAELL